MAYTPTDKAVQNARDIMDIYKNSLAKYSNQTSNSSSVPAPQPSVSAPKAPSVPAPQASYSVPAPTQSSTQLPSWMGNSYQKDADGYYSTNPSNPNASRYRADGSPVATVGLTNGQTGQKFSGYATPEQFQQLTNAGNAQNSFNLLQSMVDSGSLQKPSVPAPQQNNGYSGFSGTVPIGPPVPKPQFTSDQLSAQAWINNESSGQGGMEKYITNQNQRWAEANAKGDTDLINRLQADSKRVGYDLNPIQTGYVPAPQNGNAQVNAFSPNGGINNDSLQNEAALQMSKRRAAISQAVQTTLSGLKNTYDYTNKLKNDERVLENNDFKRNTNPFSGKTDYLSAQMLRNREIADTASRNEYNTQVASANQKLADFDTMAPEQQQTIYNELLRIERDYGMNVGQLTGNFGGQRTLAGSAQDANFTGMYNGKQTQQAQNQAFNQNVTVGEMTGYFNPYADQIAQMNTNSQAWFNASPQEKSRLAEENQRIGKSIGAYQDSNGDWVMPQSQRTLSGQNADLNQTQVYANLTGRLPNGQQTTTEQQRVLQNEWTVAEMIGVITPTIAKIYGLPEGTPTMQAKQVAANIENAKDDNTRQNKALDWSMDPNNPDNVYKSASAGALQNKGNSAEDVAKYIDSTPGIKSTQDGVTTVDKEAVERIILSSGIPEAEMAKLYQRYGLKMGN